MYMNVFMVYEKKKKYLLCMVRWQTVWPWYTYTSDNKTKKKKKKITRATYNGSLTHWGLHNKMTAIFAHNLFKCIFVNEKFGVSIQISLRYVLEGPTVSIGSGDDVFRFNDDQILHHNASSLGHNELMKIHWTNSEEGNERKTTNIRELKVMK